MTAIVIFLAAATAGLIQSVTGFGSGIMMMLFFPLLFPIIKASALSASIALVLAATLTWRYRRQCQWKLALIPACFFLITSSIAIYLVPYLPTELLKKVFGVFLIGLSVYFLTVSGKLKAKANLPTAMVCAGLSGVTESLLGIGGPPMVVYFLAAMDDKEQYLATIQFFFFVSGAYTMILRIINGIYTTDLLGYTAIGLAAITLGKFIGGRIVDRINAETMKKIIYVFLGISGIVTLI